MRYLIKIADISILADVPYFLHSSISTDEFLFPASEISTNKTDLWFDIVQVGSLPEIEDVRYTEARRVYVGEGKSAGTFFSSYPGKPPYAFVSRCFSDEHIVVCKYLSGNEKYMNYARNLVTLIDLEATLLTFDALILHASLIRYKECSIIFSAPSGTGKSTQAELWKNFEGAEILNGDRAGLRKADGKWTAYGLPFAGTSGVYRNESAPVQAIVALRQAKENRIRKIHGAEAFQYLYPETMIHRWDSIFEKNASDLLLKVIDEVPIYLLECEPNHGAVELLRDTLHYYDSNTC